MSTTRQNKCSNCHQTGHNIRKCPQPKANNDVAVNNLLGQIPSTKQQNRSLKSEGFPKFKNSRVVNLQIDHQSKAHNKTATLLVGKGNNLTLLCPPTFLSGLVLPLLPICILSAERHGYGDKPLGSFWLKEGAPNYPFFIFVQWDEKHYYQQLFQNYNCKYHHIIVLPKDWTLRGCKILRQVVKMVIESLERSNPSQIIRYIQMDDDIESVEVYNGVIREQISFHQMLLALNRIMDSSMTMSIISVASQRNRTGNFCRSSFTHASTLRCEQLMLINITNTRSTHFAPAELFDLTSKDWSYIKSNPVLKRAAMQSEDFGFCMQLVNSNLYPTTYMTTHIFSNTLKFPSVNGTTKMNGQRLNPQIFYDTKVLLDYLDKLRMKE